MCYHYKEMIGLNGIAQDLRYALRSFRGSPGFSLTAVAMLALGIGINAMIFTVTDTALFRGFPLVKGNDRILYITTGEGCCASYPDFEDWRAQSKSFERMEIVHGGNRAFSDSFTDAGSIPEVRIVTEVSSGTFRLVGQKPILGRDFLPSDEVPGAAPVVILRYDVWEHRFGKNPAILGRIVRINNLPATVIGVMPRGFSFPQNQDLWVPLVRTAQVHNRGNRNTWFVFGRLREGVTREAARVEMEAIGRRLGAAYPLTNQGRNLLPHVYNFHEFFIGPNATRIYEAMWGAVGFVLLIACANLANLLLARAMGRSREISVRIALGAGRWRIIRQLFLESTLLSAAGAFFGWWIAKFGLRIYTVASSGPSVSDAINSTWFDNMLDYSMDARVFVYLVAISIGTCLLFGLAPAGKLSKLDVNSALKDCGRGGTGGRRARRLSSLLVAAEMALAVILLSGAGLMTRSFLNIYLAETGIKADNILVTRLGMRGSDATSQVSFLDRLKRRLEALSGVDSVGAASEIPSDRLRVRAYELADAPASAATTDEQRRPTIPILMISPDYFRSLSAPMLSGRDFTEFDGASAPPVAIVNARFAANAWPREDPLGKHLRILGGQTPGPWLTVVGVASDITQNDRFLQKKDAVLYLPYRQTPAIEMWFQIRTSVPPGSLTNAVRRELRELDADHVPIFGPLLLSHVLAESYQYRAVSGVMFLICAAIALLLASIGLYAVIAHSVSQRTQEIGIRMAIGGTPRDIIALVLQQGFFPLVIGLSVGVAASLMVNRILQSSLVNVSPADPTTYLITAVLLVAAATLGCWIPARRATRVDPVVALRHD